jgi:hypothetical protein
MALSYSNFLSALQIQLPYSIGVSIATIKRLMILGSPLFSQAPNSISTLMAAKMDEISSECSRKVMGLSNGLYTTLEPIQALHIVLHEALSMVKKY